MKLGVLTVLLSNMELEDVLKKLSKLGVQTVEIGTGGYPGDAHLKPLELIDNPKKINEFKELIKKYNMEVSALSCHGNALHPNKEIADKFHKDFLNTVILAEQLGIETVVTFSGCPGGSETASYPNWVTCPWPEDFLKVLDYQWNEKLIPYWKEAAAFAKKHNVNKIAFEMHPGFCVYNPETMLRLRAAVGDIIGANFDPSHLFWQGIDPNKALIALKDCIFHFHAKDTKISQSNTSVNGVLDTKHYSDELNRSWVFRTVGYGNDYKMWKEIFSTLRMIGYDGAISIEHEDSLMSVGEGLTKAIEFLKETMIFEPVGDIFWA